MTKDEILMGFNEIADKIGCPEDRKCSECIFDMGAKGCLLYSTVGFIGNVEDTAELEREIEDCKKAYDRLDSFVMSLDGMQFDDSSITNMVEDYQIVKRVRCTSAKDFLDEVGWEC